MTEEEFEKRWMETMKKQEKAMDNLILDLKFLVFVLILYVLGMAATLFGWL